MPRKKKQQGVKAAEQAKARMKRKLEELVAQKRALNYVPELANSLQLCEQKIVQSGKESVEATFAALRDMLDRKQKESLSAVEQFSSGVQTRVDEMNSRLTEMMTAISEAVSAAERVLGQSDSSTFLSQYSEISQQLEHCLNKCLLMEAEYPGPEFVEEAFWNWKQNSDNVKESLRHLQPPKCEFDEAFVDFLEGQESDDEAEACSSVCTDGDNKEHADASKEIVLREEMLEEIKDGVEGMEFSHSHVISNEQQDVDSSGHCSTPPEEDGFFRGHGASLQSLVMDVESSPTSMPYAVTDFTRPMASSWLSYPQPPSAALPRYVRATPRFNPKTKLTVTITEAQSPHDFWVQVCGSQLVWLMDQIRVYYDKHRPEPPGRLHAGELCAACFSQDNSWYRALVFAVHNSEMFSVLYVDYGNSETVHISRLAKLNSRFLHLPFQSFHCSLPGVIPQGPAGDWDPTDVGWLAQYVADRQLTCTVLARQDCPIIPLHLVDLDVQGQGSISMLLVQSGLTKQSSADGGMFWNMVCDLSRQSSTQTADEEMKANSFGITASKSSMLQENVTKVNTTTDYHFETGHGENVPSTTDEIELVGTKCDAINGVSDEGSVPANVNSAKVTRTCTAEDELTKTLEQEAEETSMALPSDREEACDGSSSVFPPSAEAETKTLPGCRHRMSSSSSTAEEDFLEGILPVDDDGYVKLLLSHVVSPTAFFAHVVNTSCVDQFNKIRQRLDEFSQSSSSNEETFVPRLRQPCCVYSQDEKKWFRSVVIGVADATDTVRVQFVDHGEAQEVSRKDIQPLPRDLLGFPALAVRCALAGLCPPEEESSTERESIFGWSRDAVSYLRDFVSDNLVMMAKVMGSQRHSSRSSSVNGDLSPNKHHQSFRSLPWQRTIKVNLYDTSGERDLFINQVMVDNGLASSPVLARRPKVDGVRLVRLNQMNLQETAENLENEGMDTSTFCLTENDQASSLMQDALASWDPMKSDFHNMTNSYGVDLDDAGEALVRYKDRQQRPVCRLYQTSRGCHRGSQCRFEHCQPGAITNDRDSVFCDSRVADLPEPGTWVAVVVSVVMETQHCWVQLPYGVSEVTVDGVEHMKEPTGKAEDDDLESLVTRMTAWYSRQKHFTADQTYWADGELTAVHDGDDNQWYRCRVLASDGDDVHVFFIDYGHVAWVSRRKVRKLAMEFVHLPAQAIECYLANCFPPRGLGPHEWYPDGKKKLQELTAGKVLLAQVISKGANGTLSIELYDVDTDGEMYLHINEELVEQGYATVGKFRSKPWDFRTAHAALYPNKPLLLPG